MPSSTETHLPDVNVLVALTFPDHAHHRDAMQWFDHTDGYVTTPITESGLVRHALNPQVAGQQLSGAQALSLLAGVRADSRATFLPDDASLADSSLDLAVLAGHRQVTDLHLLELANRHDAVLVTFDRALGRSVSPADRTHILTLP